MSANTSNLQSKAELLSAIAATNNLFAQYGILYCISLMSDTVQEEFKQACRAYNDTKQNKNS